MCKSTNCADECCLQVHIYVVLLLLLVVLFNSNKMQILLNRPILWLVVLLFLFFGLLYTKYHVYALFFKREREQARCKNARGVLTKLTTTTRK